MQVKSAAYDACFSAGSLAY